MKNKYKGNILALTIHLMFSKRITGPVMMLFYQFFGLNFTQIGILSGIFWLSDASLEIFGGAFSDVYGRKKASILYAILGMTTFAIFIFGNSFWHFALANLIYGLSLAIGSGNASSFLYDTLRVLKLEHQFRKYRGKVIFPQKIFNGIMLLVLPYLYLHNIRLPFVLGFIFSLIAFLSAFLFFKEPPKKKSDCHKKISQAVLGSFKEIISNKKLIISVCLQCLFGFILLLFEYFQPIIKAAGLPLAYFGLVYCIARFFEGFGGYITHKFEQFSNKRLFGFNALLILVTLLGFGFANSYFLIIFIMMTGLLDGVTDILINSTINKEATTKNRTTIASTSNMISSFFISGLMAVFGYISDHAGVQGMFGWAGLSFVILSLVIFIFAKNSKSEQQKSELSPAV
ncbi:MAG: MFS transporter [Patescibacteria group bacterium]